LAPSLDDPTLGAPVMIDFSTGTSFSDVLPTFASRGWRGSIVGGINESLLPPVQSRQFRGSIVGEIGDDGIYKAQEGQEEEVTQRTDNTIMISEDEISVPGVWV